MKELRMTCFLILVAVAGYSQMGFGVKSGYNMTNVKCDSSAFTKITKSAGLNLGIFLFFPVNEKMKIQTEVGFSGGGFNTFSQSFDSDGQNVHSSTHSRRYVLNYIAIPVMAKYSINWFNLQAGPQIGLLGRALLDDTYVIQDNATVSAGTKKKDVQDFYKKVDFGLAAGLGGEWGRFQANARYYLGVMNVANYGQPLKNTSISLTVGWNLSNDY